MLLSRSIDCCFSLLQPTIRDPPSVMRTKIISKQEQEALTSKGTDKSLSSKLLIEQTNSIRVQRYTENPKATSPRYSGSPSFLNKAGAIPDDLGRSRQALKHIQFGFYLGDFDPGGLLTYRSFISLESVRGWLVRGTELVSVLQSTHSMEIKPN